MVGRLERASHRWQAPCDLRIATAGNVNCQDPMPLSRTSGTQLPVCQAAPIGSERRNAGAVLRPEHARDLSGREHAAPQQCPVHMKGKRCHQAFPACSALFFCECARVATGSRSPNVAGEPSSNQPQDQPRRHAYVEDHAPQPLQRITHGRAPCRLQRVHDHANDFAQHAKHRGQQHQANGT